jgi:Ni/Fe-hydrogenase subunit HybB-like protein
MVITSLDTFVLPGLGYLAVATAAKLLGLATVVFVGHSFAIAGHYELFNRRSKRSYRYFPTQEKIAIGLVVVAVVAYLILVFE